MIKFDLWIVSRYQMIVDFYQQKPVWFLKQIAFSLVVTSLLRHFFDQSDSLINHLALLFDLIISALFLMTSRSEFVTSSLGKSQTIRIFLIIILCWASALSLINLLSKPLELFIVVHAICSCLNDFLIISGYCFSACNPPAPRKPRSKLVLSSQL